MQRFEIETVRKENTELWINGTRVNAALVDFDALWNDDDQTWDVTLVIPAKTILVSSS